MTYIYPGEQKTYSLGIQGSVLKSTDNLTDSLKNYLNLTYSTSSDYYNVYKETINNDQRLVISNNKLYNNDNETIRLTGCQTIDLSKLTVEMSAKTKFNSLQKYGTDYQGIFKVGNNDNAVTYKEKTTTLEGILDDISVVHYPVVDIEYENNIIDILLDHSSNEYPNYFIDLSNNINNTNNSFNFKTICDNIIIDNVPLVFENQNKPLCALINTRIIKPLEQTKTYVNQYKILQCKHTESGYIDNLDEELSCNTDKYNNLKINNINLFNHFNVYNSEYVENNIIKQVNFGYNTGVNYGVNLFGGYVFDEYVFRSPKTQIILSKGRSNISSESLLTDTGNVGPEDMIEVPDAELRILYYSSNKKIYANTVYKEYVESCSFDDIPVIYNKDKTKLTSFNINTNAIYPEINQINGDFDNTITSLNNIIDNFNKKYKNIENINYFVHNKKNDNNYYYASKFTYESVCEKENNKWKLENKYNGCKLHYLDIDWEICENPSNFKKIQNLITKYFYKSEDLQKIEHYYIDNSLVNLCILTKDDNGGLSSYNKYQYNIEEKTVSGQTSIIGNKIGTYIKLKCTVNQIKQNIPVLNDNELNTEIVSLEKYVNIYLKPDGDLSINNNAFDYINLWVYFGEVKGNFATNSGYGESNIKYDNFDINDYKYGGPISVKNNNLSDNLSVKNNNNCIILTSAIDGDKEFLLICPKTVWYKNNNNEYKKDYIYKVIDSDDKEHQYLNDYNSSKLNKYLCDYGFLVNDNERITGDSKVRCDYRTEFDQIKDHLNTEINLPKPELNYKETYQYIKIKTKNKKIKIEYYTSKDNSTIKIIKIT